MNILILSMAVYYGGGESYLLNLEKILRKKYNITIITSSKTLKKKASSNITFIRKLRFIHLLLVGISLFKFIIIYKPKFIILNGPVEAFFAKPISYFGIQTVAVKHTDFYNESGILNSIKNKLLIWYLKEVSSIISVSKYVHLKVKKLNKEGVLKNSNTFFIPNWPDDEYLKIANDPFKDDKFHILIVSRLVKHKGHFDLFEACLGIDNIVLHIVGSGPFLSKYKKYSNKLKIIFHGFQENVKPFYQLCHLQVLPSYTEGGHPLCLLEGLAAGIKCIGSNIPSIMEILEPEDIFELGNPISIRNKILEKIKTDNSDQHTKQFRFKHSSRYKYFNVFEDDFNQKQFQIDKSSIANKNFKNVKTNIVTIIIPLFNDEIIIERLFSYNINNFLNRNDIEVIFIDDFSSDRTLEKLKSHLHKINLKYKIIENKENLGPAGSRNLGIQNSSGKLIAFLDSDDIWHPWKIDIQKNIMEDNAIDICVCDHQFISPNLISNFQNTLKNINFKLKKIFVKDYIFRTQFVLPSVMIKRSIALEYQFNESYRYAEDFDLWLRLLTSNKKIHKINSKLVAVVKRDNLPEFRGISDNITSMFVNITKILYIQLFKEKPFNKVIFFTSILFIQIRFLFRITVRAIKLLDIFTIRTKS